LPYNKRHKSQLNETPGTFYCLTNIFSNCNDYYSYTPQLLHFDISTITDAGAAAAEQLQ